MNKKSNILITGGSGYIGSCLALYLKKKYQIINLDKKDNKHLSIEICNLLNLKKLTDILKKKAKVNNSFSSTIVGRWDNK